jgi:hypothetical protein
MEADILQTLDTFMSAPTPSELCKCVVSSIPYALGSDSREPRVTKAINSLLEHGRILMENGFLKLPQKVLDNDDGSDLV